VPSPFHPRIRRKRSRPAVEVRENGAPAGMNRRTAPHGRKPGTGPRGRSPARRPTPSRAIRPVEAGRGRSAPRERAAKPDTLSTSVRRASARAERLRPAPTAEPRAGADSLWQASRSGASRRAAVCRPFSPPSAKTAAALPAVRPPFRARGPRRRWTPLVRRPYLARRPAAAVWSAVQPQLEPEVSSTSPFRCCTETTPSSTRTQVFSSAPSSLRTLNTVPCTTIRASGVTTEN